MSLDQENDDILIAELREGKLNDPKCFSKKRAGFLPVRMELILPGVGEEVRSTLMLPLDEMRVEERWENLYEGRRV